MKALLVAVVLALAVPAHAELSPRVEQWGQNHPDASAALAQWSTQNPQVARWMFRWDQDHPLRAHAFVVWMWRKPDQSLESFCSAHATWPAIAGLMHLNRPALDALIAWGRAHPAAVQDLAVQPRGLAWVGYHLMRAYWEPVPGQIQSPP